MVIYIGRRGLKNGEKRKFSLYFGEKYHFGKSVLGKKILILCIIYYIPLLPKEVISVRLDLFIILPLVYFYLRSVWVPSLAVWTGPQTTETVDPLNGEQFIRGLKSRFLKYGERNQVKQFSFIRGFFRAGGGKIKIFWMWGRKLGEFN